MHDLFIEGWGNAKTGCVAWIDQIDIQQETVSAWWKKKNLFFSGYHVLYIANDISGCYAAILHLFASSAGTVCSLCDKGKMNMLRDFIFSVINAELVANIFTF